jgi:hypothetical protein
VTDEIDGFIFSKSSEHLPVNIGNRRIYHSRMCQACNRDYWFKEQHPNEALPPDDPKQRCPDITKAKMLLG